MDLFASQFISENVFVLRVSAHLGGRLSEGLSLRRRRRLCRRAVRMSDRI